MEQLSGLDASFLNMETPTMFAHVAHLVICETSTAGIRSFEHLSEIVDSRLHLFPAYRRRLVEVPLGLDHPYWMEDPDFDLEYHLRHASLPAPGTDEQLGELVARIMGRPLDRRRPLWEMYIIEGLQGGRMAWLNKIHHCAIDGLSGAELLVNLLDRTPDPEERPVPERPWKPEEEPSPRTMLARAAVGAARSPAKTIRLGRALVGTVGGVRRTGRLPFNLAAVPFFGPKRDNPDAWPVPRPTLLAPRTSLNVPITAHRRFAFRSFPLDDVKLVKNAFGTTINDVILAVSAGALRAYLSKNDELPDRPLVAMVPVSVHTEDKRAVFGNRVSVLSAPLPVHIEDAVERLHIISASMEDAKETHKAVGAELLQDFTHFATPAIAGRAARVAFRTKMMTRTRPIFNLVVSNVPGPNFPLYLAGAKMLHWYPVSIINDGAGLNITVHSYNGLLDFGLLSCREVVPDLWGVMDHVSAAMSELVDAAREAQAVASA